MFSSFMSLFVYIQCGWKSQTQEDAARNKAVLSLSSSFPSPFFLAEMQAVGHAWGFQTSVCVGGPWRANPAIIAGWSGLVSAGEGKWIACYGAFQTLTPYKVFVDYIVLNLPVFTPADKPFSMWWRTKVQKAFVAFSHSCLVKNTAVGPVTQ